MRARDWKTKAGYTYGLHGTPTTFTLEERLATLEGGTECLLAPSGLAAIALVSLRAAQDRRRGADARQRLRPQQGAGQRRAGQLRHHASALRRDESGRPGGQAVGPHQAGLGRGGRARSRWNSRTCRRWWRLCRARGVLTALDNTWGAGLAFAPFDFNGSGQGVDISVHALTKYPSGGGDVLMGSVVTARRAAAPRDQAHPHAHGLRHRRRRRRGACCARCPASRCATRRTTPARANWPAGSTAARRDRAGAAPGARRLARATRTGCDCAAPTTWRPACSRWCSTPRYGTEQVDRFCDSLKLFRLGYSWGGPISLVVPYDIGLMRDASVARWPHKGTLVRFSIGLEDVEDLRADLEQALSAL